MEMVSGSHTGFCLFHAEANEAHSRSATGFPRAASSGDQGLGDGITEPKPIRETDEGRKGGGGGAEGR